MLLRSPIVGVIAFAAAVTFADGRRNEGVVAGWRLQEASKVEASGSEISRVGFRSRDWYSAVVPGTVLTTLVANRVYPEPLFGENNRTIPESLCRVPYWYRTEIEVPKSHTARYSWLRFAGTNYVAEVWVNGQAVGTVRGAFARGEFDVTRYVRPGSRAAVAVRILPPPHPSAPHEQSLAAGTGPNGGAMGADGPTFVATVGWDWMPGIRDRDIGIWQSVTLGATGPVAVRDPWVRPDLPLPRTDSATLRSGATVRNLSSEPQSGLLVATVDETRTLARVALRLAPGETRTVTLPDMEMNRPRLWWPNGYGKQDLYRMKFRFETGTSVSDEESIPFGVRELGYFRGDDKNLTVTVNGVPVMCKGGNWGMDEAMKRSPRARLEAQIRLHRDANCTMIRNWVGQSTQEDFYDLCDRYGILVWDDFWLANPVDGPNPEDPALFLENAREKILRFRNHPSIALWCGRNEGDPPPTINPGLAALVKELDDRHYQPHSANYNGVSGYGPYGYRKPADYFRFGDAFHTEIGTVSIPTLEAIESMMPRKDWWPINDDWAYHGLTRGAQGGDRFPSVVAARYGSIRGLADFVRKSQMVNYESHRAIYEGRNSKLFKPASGVLIWMSNPAQPSFVWQLYSYDLEPNASLFGTKKACEPIHVQMDPEGRVQVINNLPAALSKARVRASVFDIGSKPVDSTEAVVDAPGSAATDAMTVKLPAGSPVYFVKLVLFDARGKALSENFYWYAKPDASNDYVPNDFTSLERMPKVTLDTSAVRVSRNRIRLTLHNPASVIALMIHAQLRTGASGKQRVLPVYYSDNYVSLLPGETRTIDVEAAGGNWIEVDGWNVDVRETTSRSSELVPLSQQIHVFPNREMDPGLPTPVPVRVSERAGIFRSLNAGGERVEGSAYLSDENFVEGGQSATREERVDPSAAGDKAGPAEMYRTSRWGESTYTIPVPSGGVYTVRLHFAELTFAERGRRRFRVEINGEGVLNDFDVFAEAGRGKALVKDFPDIRPDAQGNIVIAFRRGAADRPEVRGIQILRTQAVH